MRCACATNDGDKLILKVKQSNQLCVVRNFIIIVLVSGEGLRIQPRHISDTPENINKEKKNTANLIECRFDKVEILTVIR